MKRLLLTAIISLLAATNSWGTTNYNSSKSNVYLSFPDTTVTTASANVSFAGGVVYTTPASGDFILTEFCADPSAYGGIRLQAANFGTIAQTVSGTNCYTFTPGMAIPQSTALTCEPAATVFVSKTTTNYCTISGMQTTPPP